MEIKMNFPKFIYEKRVKLGYTLRKFCEAKGYDPAYISRLENGLIMPPDEADKLKALAIALELKKQTSEWVNFFDLAAISKNKLPEDITKDNPNLVSFLPAFYRTLRNKKMTK
ncbi:MAG: helix-turn-helix transcriptional regulator, partial [Patescibacteria group bacterium]|nr:helix-turn-helix transcriptional regulator [Patescibacteria group bacterium]